MVIAGTVGLCFVAGLGAAAWWWNRQEQKPQDDEPVELPPHDVIPGPDGNLKKVVLDNGLTVLVCKQGTAPKVLVQIAYDVGSAIEQEGERGLAHLLEHMIFKGTDKLVEGDIDAIARKYGADFNAFTSHDMTSYYFEADAKNWQHFLPVLADCMQNAKFDDQHLASEVKAVIQELRMYKDSHWHVIFEHAFTNIFPANHPYHHPIIGYKEDLADISGARLKAFYDKYYHPSRAVLCVVGDVDIDEAVAKAREAFEGITSSAQDHQPPFIPLTHPLSTYSSTLYKDVQHEQVGLYWRIPGLDAGNHVLVSAVEYVLGGGLASCMHRRLVDELQIASSVSVGSEQFAVAGVFLVSVQPKEGKREECIAAVTEQITQLAQEGCTQAELYKMVKNRQRQYMLALHNLSDFVYHWLESFFATRDELNFFNDANAYAAVEPAHIKRFCAQWLSPRDMHRVILAPLAPESRELWQQEQAKEEAYYDYLLERHKRTDPLSEPEFVHTLSAPTPLTFSFPQPTRVARQLSNKLAIITHTDTSMPLVSAVLLFKQSGYLSRSLQGIGIDLMMTLLLEGSKGMNRQQILEQFDMHGAQYGYNGRGMSLVCSHASFGAVFAHAMSVLTQPRFKKAAFEKVKAIFIHSYQQQKDSPRQVAMRTLKQAIYYKHPYGWSFDEAIEYIEALTLKDIEKLHARYVCPAHMVLSVAGDVEPAFVEHCVLQNASEWPVGSFQAPVYPARQQPEKTAVTIPMLRDQVVLVYGRPSGILLHEPNHIILDVLSYVCFHSLGSRLFALRERTGLFYTASGAWGADVHQEHGFDYLCAIVSPENIEHAQTAIMNMAVQVAKEGITQRELDAARQMYTKDLIDLTVDVRQRAGLFANIETLGIGYDYYDKALQLVHSLTVEQVNEVAKEYVSKEGFVRVAVGRVGRKDSDATTMPPADYTSQDATQ